MRMRSSWQLVAWIPSYSQARRTRSGVYDGAGISPVLGPTLWETFGNQHTSGQKPEDSACLSKKGKTGKNEAPRPPPIFVT